MYVCVCMAVTDAQVESAICNGAHTREGVTRACRAGGDCGACHGMIEQMIEDHLDAMAPTTTGSPPPVSGERLVAVERLSRKTAA